MIYIIELHLCQQPVIQYEGLRMVLRHPLSKLLHEVRAGVKEFWSTSVLIWFDTELLHLVDVPGFNGSVVVHSP